MRQPTNLETFVLGCLFIAGQCRHSPFGLMELLGERGYDKIAAYLRRGIDIHEWIAP